MHVNWRSRRSEVLEDRVRVLEDRVTAITEAARVLAHGLEDLPADEPGGKQAADAARLAHNLLLTAEPPAGQPGQRAGT